MRKRALITGIAGQDGYYMNEFLMNRGYEVAGIDSKILPATETSPSSSTGPIYGGSIGDTKFIEKVLEDFCPNEIYHFAALSNVVESYEKAETTYEINALASYKFLSAVAKFVPAAKVYLAGSSEMFGNPSSSPQTEDTPFAPVSPYGWSKVAMFYGAKSIRMSKEQFNAVGITYNHESERRPPNFVTQKICQGLVSIAEGRQSELVLGNLAAIRDWGYAGDYVEAMWQVLQLDSAQDLIIATGVGHTVEEFVNAAANALGLPLFWEGNETSRVARNNKGKMIIRVSPDFYRPQESSPLVGDASRLRRLTPWSPKTTFEQLVEKMVQHAFAEVPR